MQPQSEQEHGETQPEMHPLARAETHPSMQPQSEQEQGETQPEMHPPARTETHPSMQPQSEQEQGEMQPEMHPCEARPEGTRPPINRATFRTFR